MRRALLHPEPSGAEAQRAIRLGDAASPVSTTKCRVSGGAASGLGRLLGRDIDVPAITLAVEGLSGIGQRWDASQLAAQAALHSTDRKVSLDLLNLARAAHSGKRSKSTSPSAPSRASQLTDREWEIARLVVQGIGYREIGERLYISPRTVEHHVASVRRRLGSANRAEMIDTLRRLLVGSSTGDGQ